MKPGIGGITYIEITYSEIREPGFKTISVTFNGPFTW